MTWADANAVANLIRTVPALASKTWLTVVPAGLPVSGPYCLVHPAEGVDEQTRMSGPPITTHPRFTLHLCGLSAEQVLALYDLVKPLFHSNGFVAPPAVAGRVAKNGFWESPIPLQNDSDVTPPIVYQVIELGWTSDPA